MKIYLGNEELVKKLIAAGANLNAENEDGQTAIFSAIEHGKLPSTIPNDIFEFIFRYSTRSCQYCRAAG